MSGWEKINLRKSQNLYKSRVKKDVIPLDKFIKFL